MADRASEFDPQESVRINMTIGSSWAPSVSMNHSEGCIKKTQDSNPVFDINFAKTVKRNSSHLEFMNHLVYLCVIMTTI